MVLERDGVFFQRLCCWRVDPDRSGLRRMLWSGAREPLGIAGIGRIENLLALLDYLSCDSVVPHLRGEHDNSAEMMFVVVPGKERLTNGPGVLDRSEAIRKLGPVFEGFEVALQVRVVFRDVGLAVSFGHAQIGHQQRYWLGRHRGAAVGVDG